MNNSIRLFNALRQGRGSAQSGLISVRNASAEHHGHGIPFPPGPRQFQQLKNWAGTGFLYGGVGFGLLCYFSDWKVVCTYIPFYNGKFKDEAE